MRYMTTCCCRCCTVQTGSRILSIINLVGHGLCLLCTVLMLIFFDYIMEEARREREREMSDLLSRTFSDGKPVFTVEATIDQQAKHRLFSAFVAGAVLAAIGTIVGILFVYGAFKNKRYLILPHLVFDAIYTVAIIILAIVLIAGQVGELPTSAIAATAVSAIISLIVQLYFFFVVLSFYKNLEFAERNPQPSVAYTAAPQSDPHSYPTQQGQYYPTVPQKDGTV